MKIPISSMFQYCKDYGKHVQRATSTATSTASFPADSPNFLSP